MEKGLPVGLHKFINDMKQQYTVDLVNSECVPRFFHEYALSRLRSEGYRLACASNSIRNTVQLMMERSSLLPYLEFFLSNQDVKKAKPDPEIYNVSIERLGLRPDEVMVLEDNRNGIRAATDAGAHVMKIDTVYDVNYENIMRHIAQIENEAGKEAVQ